MKKISLILAVLLLIPVLSFAEPLYPSTKIPGTSRWTITWNDATATTDNQTPTTDTAMNIFRADTVSIQCSTLTADDTGGTSNLATSIDIDVLGSEDCSTFDDVTNPYVTLFSALADNKAISTNMTDGHQCIKLRLDANGTGTADCTCRITATWN